jgi:hypothetical protein
MCVSVLHGLAIFLRCQTAQKPFPRLPFLRRQDAASGWRCPPHHDWRSRRFPASSRRRDYGAILGSEFSQLQAENEMKFAPIHPRPDTDPNPYNFRGGDALVVFAQSHNMVVRGHTLVWHDAGAGVGSQRVAIRAASPCGDSARPHLHRHDGTMLRKSTRGMWSTKLSTTTEPCAMTVWYDHPGIGVGEGHEIRGAGAALGARGRSGCQAFLQRLRCRGSE